MLLQYCFNDTARKAYKLSHKVVLKGTIKAYASKIEELRNYARSQGYNAPVYIFNPEIVKGHP